MNARKRQLIQMILNGNAQFKLKDVENMFGVSERTLRYDVEEIAGWLKQFGHTLEHVSGQGMWKLTSNPNADDVKDIFEALNFYGRSMSVEERFLLIVHELIIQDDWLFLRQIAEELDVSKATVLQQMEQVETWTNEFQLVLERSRKGFRLQGTERHKRLALLSVMEKLEEAWDTVNPIPNLNWSELSLKDLEKTFTLLEDRLEQRANVTSFFRVWALHMQRTRSGDWLQGETASGMTVDSWFTELWQEMTEEFRLEQSEDEMVFAYLYLRATGGIYNTEVQSFQDDQLFQSFVEKMSSRMGLAGFTDEQLMDIYEEWVSFLTAKAHDIIYIHPLQKKIEEQYPFIIFHIQETLAEEINSAEPVRRDSMTPLAICMAAIYEKSSFENERYQVWVVCPGGIAASRLLTVTLMKHFPQIEVKKTLAIAELRRANEWEQPDFVVSSVSLHDSPYAHVTVKPVMTKDDLMKVDNFINNSVRKNVSSLSSESDRSIEALIPRERLAVIENAGSDQLEAIIDAGVGLLRDDQLVTERFLDDIHRTVFEKSYLYEIIPGLLFIHTDSENVLKPGFSLVQLKNPFVREDKLHSQAVLFMATPDKHSHVPQLQYLYQLLMNEDRVAEMLHWSKLSKRGEEDE
ncbi:BglG family transcription antiterminator [Salisediminibacterium halotolerans]|uniref:BglG family transcription antiterminator n=1 Tax=Salisediminibacterium halotolerans TaxID=517425 RepID=UPI000EAEED01|nr:PTS sugar transporter subunit IIA [Salisediminibacterium halotolerans]RLJ72298.1 Mga-like protein with HTH domain [Actinophytocola xinjiangensis]RPE85512.1 Mga-like protein with HTH domain [Salisediminibacterium halotolerans]TWG33467.1 Mga-like protein with HTH domain [Salisediminibacterium halotolerans]GEL07918.1 hypothetical protein SHA02_13340 [Salisediminibacterium halotolerans]